MRKIILTVPGPKIDQKMGKIVEKMLQKRIFEGGVQMGPPTEIIGRKSDMINRKILKKWQKSGNFREKCEKFDQKKLAKN